MDTIVQYQSEKIAFKWEGIINEDIQKAMDLKLAFMIHNQPDDRSLFVKTGEYQAATKKEGARIKYSNVPVGYWVVIDDYCVDKKNGNVVFMKKAKIIKDKNFSSKYRILNNEPTLFDNSEENQTEESNLIKDITVKEYDNVTQLEIGLNVEEVKNILRENKKEQNKEA
ncbi:hypothetical protein [Brachyspira hyodysenteriae]|uniref:hypothetical protein n=1 Tax=Brachyspira hyodysenteriae TaxID=159 RepID=UPI00063D95CD|nr:hypothetical protein [Brachyspira hyodysenteriae]KLI53654.1 hypothetical protein SZ42_00780 [Brachyspira hyodysenteriae]HJH54787.1 hypothetical protein [Brachyspira hyodysenteriae]